MFGLPLKRGGLRVGFGMSIPPERANLVRPRWVAWVWAKWFGYFWLPCPICERNFAGFEWGASLYRGPHAGSGTCARPTCVAMAGMINSDFDGPWFNQIQYFDPDSLWVRFIGIKWLGATVLWIAAALNLWIGQRSDSRLSWANLTLAGVCIVLGFVSLWFHYVKLPRISEQRRKKMEEAFAELDRKRAAMVQEPDVMQ